MDGWMDGWMESIQEYVLCLCHGGRKGPTKGNDMRKNENDKLNTPSLPPPSQYLNKQKT